MVLALILLALGSLLVVPLLTLTGTSLNYHQLIERKTLESYSADSGVEYVLTKLYNRPGAYTSENLTASFTINDRTVNVTAHYEGSGIYKVTSIATSPNGRSTKIVCYVNLSAGAFAYVVAAKDSMTIENATVNATNPGEANIHSNGNIALIGGGVLVDGDASAVGTITGVTITGMVMPGSSEVAFPGDYSELYKAMAKEVGTRVGDVTLTGGNSTNPIAFPSASYPYAYIQGNLTILPDSYVRLTSTVYVTGIIEVKPRSVLDGNENILAEQRIRIDAGGFLSDRIPVVISNATGDDAIYCTGGTGENVVINAVVYAPNGKVTLTGKARLYGAVGGNTVVINNATITYAAQLQGRQDLPGGELHTIAYSFN